MKKDLTSLASYFIQYVKDVRIDQIAKIGYNRVGGSAVSVRTVSATEAKDKFSDLLRSAEYNQERIIIERSGRPAAVLISVGDLEFLERVEDHFAFYEIEQALKKSKRSRPIERVIVDYERKHGVRLKDLKDSPDEPDL